LRGLPQSNGRSVGQVAGAVNPHPDGLPLGCIRHDAAGLAYACRKLRALLEVPRCRRERRLAIGKGARPGGARAAQDARQLDGPRTAFTDLAPETLYSARVSVTESAGNVRKPAEADFVTVSATERGRIGRHEGTSRGFDSRRLHFLAQPSDRILDSQRGSALVSIVLFCGPLEGERRLT
jgi:hypothetical protein